MHKETLLVWVEDVVVACVVDVEEGCVDVKHVLFWYINLNSSLGISVGSVISDVR